jgi:hypothetical protein
VETVAINRGEGRVLVELSDSSDADICSVVFLKKFNWISRFYKESVRTPPPSSITPHGYQLLDRQIIKEKAFRVSTPSVQRISFPSSRSKVSNKQVESRPGVG